MDSQLQSIQYELPDTALSGEVTRQARPASQRCLDSLSPLTPHRDEPATVLTKDREMPPLRIVTGLPGPASTPWKQASCPGGREQQQASCSANPPPPNPASQTHFISKLHILKQNSAKPLPNILVPRALQAVVRPHGSETAPRGALAGRREGSRAP